MKQIINSSKLISLSVLLCVCFASPVQSQVTIGNTTPPLEGLLLELKELDKNDGSYNATKGMKFPRVELREFTDLYPLVNAANATVKTNYKGTVVYNTVSNTALEKGLYVWDGEAWARFYAKTDITTGIQANNGLSVSSGVVRLGGDLVKNTEIGLVNNYNLIFTRGTGNIGIGATVPRAPLHIDAAANPLRIENLKSRSDAHNSAVDNANTVYHDLVISPQGVLRTAPITPRISNENESVIYRLSRQYTPLRGMPDGGHEPSNGDPWLYWIKDDQAGTGINVVTLPQDGAYVFAFRFYGTFPSASDNGTNSFYLYAFKNGTNPSRNIVDAAEIIVNRFGYNTGTYFVTLSVTGQEGDQIRFKLTQPTDAQPNVNTNWTLQARNSSGVNNASMTTMVYWAL